MMDRNSIPFLREIEQCRVNTVSNHIIQSNTKIKTQWRRLDEQVKAQSSKLSTVTTPRSGDVTSISEYIKCLSEGKANCNILDEHERIKYQRELSKLFGDVVKAQDYEAILNENKSSTMKVLNNEKLVSTFCVPEIECDYKEYHKATKRDTNNRISNTIYSFSVYDTSNFSLQQRLELLSHHTLDDLSKTIYCVHNQIKSSCNQDFMPSSFFYIENNLYVDDSIESIDENEIVQKLISWLDNLHSSTMNAPTNSLVNSNTNIISKNDSSINSTIRNTSNTSSSKRKRNVELFNMSNTRLSDVDEMKIGRKYLYCHYSCCEHLLILTDIRLDEVTETEFPRELFRMKFPRRKCQVCDVLYAKFVTYDDRLAETSPAFFCDYCYQLLHYDAEGFLIYNDFIVYQYEHNE